MHAGQAAYLYVLFERAGVQPVRANPTQMKAMVKQLHQLSPQTPSVPPIEEHLGSLGINAAVPEIVESIAHPPSHHWETARRTLEQPASIAFQKLFFNVDESDGSRPEDFPTHVSCPRDDPVIGMLRCADHIDVKQ